MNNRDHGLLLSEQKAFVSVVLYDAMADKIYLPV